jgi:hypothetical protein
VGRHAVAGLSLVALSLLAACTTSATREATSSTQPSSPVDGTHAAPTPAQLPPLTLTASLDEPLVDWREVACLPSGDAREKVGVDPCSDCVLPVPAALAVAQDGSFWIADPLKQRIAHFSSDGSFLGAIPVERGPADLVFVGDRLYALLEVGRAAIVRVERGGVSKEIIANDEGKALHVQGLIGGQEELVALIAGAERLLGAYWAMATVDPVTGQVTRAAGAQVSGNRFMDFVPLLDTPEADYEIRWSDGERTTEQLVIRFQLALKDKQLRTSVGDTYVRTSNSGGVMTLVNLAGREGLPLGRWYLEIPANGAEPIFERVPMQGFIGDALRYLAVGDGGTVYWMQLLDDGLHVYRRGQQ